jgi:chromosomal replication initiator protein
MVDTIWSEAQRQLRGALATKDYEFWIAPLRLARHDADEVTLEVASQFARDWIAREYRALIERASGSRADATNVRLVVNRQLAPSCQSGARRSRSRRPRSTRTRRTLHLRDLRRPGRQRGGVPGRETIVEHPGNATTRSSSRWVRPRKTRLLSAIGRGILRAPRWRRLRLTEHFVNDMVGALRRDQMDRFRHRYRAISTLVVDDVQFLRGKKRSQESSPTRSRLARAGQADRAGVRPAAPSCPTWRRRSAAASRPACSSTSSRPTSASAVCSSSGTGALELTLQPSVVGTWPRNGVRTCASSRHAHPAGGHREALRPDVDAVGGARGARALPPTARTAERVGRPHHRRGVPALSRDAGRAHVTRRTARVSVPRQVAMFLCRRHTEAPLQAIGAEFGGRDHSTVVHALGAVERRLAADHALRDAVAALEARLTG